VDIQTTEEDATEGVSAGSQSEDDTGDVDGAGDGAHGKIGARDGGIRFVSNPPGVVMPGLRWLWPTSPLTASLALAQRSSGRLVPRKGVLYGEDRAQDRRHDVRDGGQT
jgi:hypothetical protein